MSDHPADFKMRPNIAFSPESPHHGKPLPLAYVKTGTSIGYQSWFLEYRNTSGPGNQRPGFPTVVTTPVTWPPGPTQGVTMLSGFWGCYLDDNGNPFHDHWIGGLQVQSFFQDNSKTLGCEFWLTDASQDRSVDMKAWGLILFYTHA